MMSFCSLGLLGIHIYKTVSQGLFREFVLCSIYFSQYFSFVSVSIRPLHSILDLILFTSLRFPSLSCNDSYFISALHNSHHIIYSIHASVIILHTTCSPLLRFRIRT